MSDPVLLKEKEPEVDRARIGVSYSGGGSLLLIELGVVSAFIKKGIRPSVITGVSAGAFAGVAHALDPVNGRGVDMAKEILRHVSNRTMGLSAGQFLVRLLIERSHIRSLGDSAGLKPLIRQNLKAFFGLEHATAGLFAPPAHPKLLIGATNRADGTALWMAGDTPIEDALVESSAIPGVFPWRQDKVDGQNVPVVDGAVITNQPLSNLVMEGCGTIFACAVGYEGGALPPPTNALSNLYPLIDVMMHQTSKLEQEYVQLRLGDRGVIHHIHPEVACGVAWFNFTSELIDQVTAASEAATLAWLDDPQRFPELNTQPAPAA